jgi:hypothetical protein
MSIEQNDDSEEVIRSKDKHEEPTLAEDETNKSPKKRPKMKCKIGVDEGLFCTMIDTI